MLLLSDPAVAAVPVRDSGEPLLDVRDASDLLLDHRKADGDGSWARLRQGVLERLVAAEQQLPDGVRLLIVEGHRPAALQRRYFDEHCADLVAAGAGPTLESVREEASQHLSPPEVAPHPCGSAVDLTLVVDGREVDMGCPVNATPTQSAGACFTEAPAIAASARHWREVLGSALTDVGLVNYPPEWWHWSYGDRYWAVVTGAPAALHAPI